MPKAKRYTKAVEPASGCFIRPLRAQNSAQDIYLSLLREQTVTFCTGPAGTGKTYLATYVALEALLLDSSVERIILTRPIVATEDIGYLPGTMDEKIHPYVLPLFDAVESHLGVVKTKELHEDRRIEVLPLAYMRGRSLNNAFLVLDEAQNCTQEQMKMFLTRIGYGSKMVICGDASQSDLAKGMENGLSWAVSRLKGCHGSIGVTEFSRSNIVRNPLIETMLQHLEGPGPKKEAKAPSKTAQLLTMSPSDE